MERPRRGGRGARGARARGARRAPARGAAGRRCPAARLQRFAAETAPRRAPARRRDAFARDLARAPRRGRVDGGGARAARAPRSPAARRGAAALGGRGRAAHFGVDAGVFADGDRTLVVELRAPTPYFLELTAFYPDLPGAARTSVEAGAPHDWFLPGRSSSATGRSRLAEWRVGERIRLVRSETYWDRDGIRLASVDVLPTENATTALNLYLAGEADWLPAPELPARPRRRRCARRPDFYASAAASSSTSTASTATRPPFDDPRVREAFALAVDREAIVRDVLRLGQLPAHHLVPPGLPGYAAAALGAALRPRARARAPRRGRLRPGGRGFPTVGILYNTAEVPQADRRGASPTSCAASSASRCGPTTRSGRPTRRACSPATTTSRAPAGSATTSTRTRFLDLWVSGGGNNQTGWGDARYDAWIRAAADVDALRARARAAALAGSREPEAMRALLAAAAAAPDAAARREALAALRMQLFREAEALLVQEAFPVLPLYFYVVSGLVAPRVGGFHAELVDAGRHAAARTSRTSTRCAGCGSAP